VPQPKSLEDRSRTSGRRSFGADADRTRPFTTAYTEGPPRHSVLGQILWIEQAGQYLKDSTLLFSMDLTLGMIVAHHVWPVQLQGYWDAYSGGFTRIL
jgi:hypothetical protein